jgi:plasmid stability protein
VQREVKRMAGLEIQDLDEGIIAPLRERAAKQGVSPQEHLRSILRKAAHHWEYFRAQPERAERMASLEVDDLDETIIALLRGRAAWHGVFLQDELRSILREAAAGRGPPPPPPSESECCGNFGVCYPHCLGVLNSVLEKSLVVTVVAAPQSDEPHREEPAR